MASELVKRMHERAILCDYQHGDPSSAHTADVLREAATLLSSQEAEIERLRVALKPFADDAERLRNYPDDYPYGFPITPITVGDFRRARAALTPLPEGGNG